MGFQSGFQRIFFRVFGEAIALSRNREYMFSMDKDVELTCRIACEILRATDAWTAGDKLEDELPSATELARQLDVKLEKLKKKLRLLRQENLIRSVSVSPKRYRFDRYALREMPPDHPLYALLFGEDSPYRIAD